MKLNLIFLIFCILVSWLLFRFPLKNAKTPVEYRKILMIFWVLFGFVLFNTLFAFLGMGGLKSLRADSAISDRKALSGKETNDGVVLVGKVSEKNGFVSGNYVAYLDEDHLWTPDELWIDMQNGSIAVTNDRYQATSWPVDARGFSYLPVGQAVTVVGYIEDNKNLASGDQFQSIRADIVFGGPYEDFISRARVKEIFAAALVLVNLFVAIMIFLLPIQDCNKGIKDAEH